VFTAPWLADNKRTVIIDKTLDPVYSDEDVPMLEPFISNRDYLQLQHLFFIVRDYDHATKDDEMGQTVISLRDAFGPEPVPFVATVIDKGAPYGTFYGKVHITFGKAKRGRGAPSVLEEVRRGVSSLNDAVVTEILQSVTSKDPRAALVALAAVGRIV